MDYNEMYWDMMEGEFLTENELREIEFEQELEEAAAFMDCEVYDDDPRLFF